MDVGIFTSTELNDPTDGFELGFKLMLGEPVGFRLGAELRLGKRLGSRLGTQPDVGSVLQWTCQLGTMLGI